MTAKRFTAILLFLFGVMAPFAHTQKPRKTCSKRPEKGTRAFLCFRIMVIHFKTQSAGSKHKIFHLTTFDKAA